MTDMLERGLAWLEEQRHERRTAPVVYRRGATETTLQATVGRTLFSTEDAYGRLQHVESRDYLVRAEDLVLAGVKTLPESGDEIMEAEDADGHVYEVMAPGGEPAWRWSDPYRKTLRIHTKQTGGAL